jgi:hypothetical protein
MKRVHLGCLVALAASLATGQAQTVSVNFNAASALDNNFNIYQNTTPAVTNGATGSPYSQALTGGVGGSGLVNIAVPVTGITGDSTAIYKNTSFDFSTSGKALTISAYINIIPPTESGNRLLQLGFVNENTAGMNGNAGLAFTSMRLNPTAIGSTVFGPQWQTKTAAGSTVNTSGGANMTLLAGDWYQMSLTFANLGGGNIQASGFVQDFGVNGLTPGAIVNISQITLTSADIAGDSAVWPAFRSFAADGSGGLDNFNAAVTVVPEPGTMVLVGLGLGTLLLAGRRQRNR